MSKMQFEQLFAQYRERLHRLCFAVTGNAADAEDALQEAFVDVYRGLPSFRGEAAPYTWLYRVALRAAIRLKARQQRHVADGEMASAEATPQADPRGGLEARGALQRALAQLSAEQRSLLALSVDGATQEELADILGIPVGTVWSRLHAARKRLMSSLQ